MTIHTGNVEITPEEVGFHPEHIKILDQFFLQCSAHDRLFGPNLCDYVKWRTICYQILKDGIF